MTENPDPRPILPAPDEFEGPFSDYFTQWIEPNLPSPAVVAAFDKQMREYLTGPEPLHVLRKLPRQERGIVYETDQGARILPADNSPGWWLHRMLLSDSLRPENASELFADVPTHFFEVAAGPTLNRAEFHLAHVLDVGDRNTRWELWDRNQTATRMLRNLHPCNWFLLGKPDWRRAGADPEIIAWIEHTYAHRYGEVFETFRRTVGAPMPPDSAPSDPVYRYRKADPTVAPRITRNPAPEPRRRNGKATENPRRLNRPAIWQDLLGKDIDLLIRLHTTCYAVPHDALAAWVGENTKALATESWQRKGHYSWPKVSEKMQGFLDPYETDCPPD